MTNAEPTRAHDDALLTALDMRQGRASFGEIARALGRTRNVWIGRVSRVLEADRLAHGEAVR